MPDTIKIVDVPGFAGEYEWDMEGQPMSGLEVHWIKKISGARLGEIGEAIGAGDYDVVIALATCALVRAGKVHRAQALAVAELLRDAPAGTAIDYVVGENEEVKADEAVPPVSEQPSSDGDGDKPTSSSETSERFSVVSPETGPPPTGLRDSA